MAFKRIVVKVGTSSLTYENGRTNIRRVNELIKVLADIANSGVEICFVSSGAIGVGVGKLGLKERPTDTQSRQAASSIGQCELMFMYDKAFSEYNHIVGQLLITKSDVENDERRRNLINTFNKLFEFGAIPIVNENDSIAVDEIVYGDNDNLSAIVAKLINADLLVILTDADGLFDKNPSEYPDAKLISAVDKIDESILRIASPHGSYLGTGGMATKVQAARVATEAGIETVVMNGSDPAKLYDVVDGKSVGTVFKAVK
jgi:glutamate 5-kinase